MKTSSLLVLASCFSGALARGAVRRENEEFDVHRVLSKGKGGKGGKGKGRSCGKGKGKSTECPDGQVFVNYDIKFDKDFDREAVLASPNINFGLSQAVVVAIQDIYEVDSSVYLFDDVCGTIGCVDDITEYSFTLYADEST